jgi:threonine synthase
MLKQYTCSECGRVFAVGDQRFQCDCGGAFELEKSIDFLVDRVIRRKPTMWRYREALPIDGDEHIVTFDEGMTPLVEWNYNNSGFLVKLDYVTPTGSFKDRGSSVLLSHLVEIGVDHFIEDSSGNAGSSIAAYAAKSGLRCEIYCPDYASEGKLAQISFYGAKLRKIRGTRADTAKVVQEKAKETYYASHNWNPFFIEGLKTMAFEIAEQLDWHVPDNVICPLGFGGLFMGLYIGFKELMDHDVTEKIPRLLGVQSEACCPIYEAYQKRSDSIEEYDQKRKTLAEGICATNPMRGKTILQVLKETQGAVAVVSEKEIVEGVEILARSGLFVEPTSAVVVKAIDRFQNEGILSEKDQTVLVLTGTGLKALSDLYRIAVK